MSVPYLIDNSEYKRADPEIKVRCLIFFLKADEIYCMTYHSRTRFATNKSGVDVLVSFVDTASSNIILSSSSGRCGCR